MFARLHIGEVHAEACFAVEGYDVVAVVALCIVALLCLAGTANAQRTEITASYGAYTQMDATDMHDGWNHERSISNCAPMGTSWKAQYALV